MILDKDLQTIQGVRDLCAAAKAAQQSFAEFSQEEVDKVIAAMAEAGYKASEKLAQSAVRETGYGNVPDKIKKNQFSTRDIFESIRELPTVGIVREDRKNRILEIAQPMGVVAAIIPTTNPTSTTMFKILISLKARNGIVISPHPRAKNCITEAANIVNAAAIQAGAPRDLIGVISTPSLAATNELMRCRDTDVILATGGTGLVRAAYSAGKPAYGVGPGNVPSYVDRSANYKKAVDDIVAGKTFDYGTLCSSEQAVIVDAPLKAKVKQALADGGAHFLSQEEISKLEKVLVTPDCLINPNLVGKSPQVLARAAGFAVPDDTRLLVAELQGVGKMYPLSAEKLSPVLALYSVNGWEEGIRRCVEVLDFGGKGHTASVHAQDDDVIRQFGVRVPAFRIVVNSPSSIGAVGYTNQLMPSLTLGCGSFGRNITSDNITTHHLMNLKRVAYETRPLSEPRNGTSWRASVKHDWRNADAPYSKALSSDVSRKGSEVKSRPSEAQKAGTESSTPVSFGSSGMSEAEVERVIADFLSEGK